MITATSIQQVTLAGDGLGGGGIPLTTRQSPANNNAPDPIAYQLQPGNNTCLVPGGGFVVQGVQLDPAPNSTNQKSITTPPPGNLVALSGWTAASVTLPAVAGGQINIFSTSQETVRAVFF